MLLYIYIAPAQVQLLKVFNMKPQRFPTAEAIEAKQFQEDHDAGCQATYF